jgi:hypothetical protein
MSTSRVSTTHESPWQIAGNLARLQSPALRAEADVTNAASGVRILAVRGKAITDLSLFRLRLPRPSTLIDPGEGKHVEQPFHRAVQAPTVDFVVRGDDLIATYSETAEYPFRAQVYWRFSPPRRTTMNSRASLVVADLELILSIQTSLLDSDPTSMVETELSTAQANQLVDPPSSRIVPLQIAASPLVLGPVTGAGCFLFRLADAPLVYVEMIHPADFHRSTIKLGAGNESSLCLSHQLFPQRLEKGVILRSRVHSFFTPAETDPATIARAYEEFAASAPPLTV